MCSIWRLLISVLNIFFVCYVTKKVVHFFMFCISNAILMTTCMFLPCQRTPLHIAVREGHVNIVNLLVDKGADISSKDDRGVSMCH